MGSSDRVMHLSKFFLHSLRISILSRSIVLGNIIGHVSAYRNDQNLSDTHNVSHNLNDAIRRLAFQVKAFSLGSEISYSY